MLSRILQLAASILIAQSAGLIGYLFTAPAVGDWYAALAKPPWTPPSWVFNPVWVTMYTLMGVAAYLIWRRRDAPGARIALIVYGVHLVLNALWSIIFFGLQNPGLAFAEILVLLVFIVATTVLFGRVNVWAGALLLPYIAWVSFAATLNYGIWRLN